MAEIINNIPMRIPRAPRGKLNDAQQYAKDHNINKYQGNPCKHNHSGLRYTRNGKCVECSYYKPTGRKAGSLPNPFRAVALKAGEKFYNTGKPCRAGHMSRRYTATSRCEECHKIYMLEVRKPKERQYGVLNKYGLTQEDYDKMLASQNFVCAICEQPETIKLNDKVKPLAVDHCHDTGKVRGLLCANCNLGIGNLCHNPEIIKRAALYCEEL